ncbi:hypothetical protein BJ741DRAFT_296218 [Chytriomyces cf. hyalinus JEL632]|nr:hypothetical protein BJ741DRAFT_296218 [Chytriomyces cf. hyalinus JEL632]
MSAAMSAEPSEDSILKPSTLGAAGLKSLINRRIDGEDVVKMTRKMKGQLRDEFIGYVEILSKNGQMMCKCERRAAVVTNTDGVKAMVGTDCLTPAPCSFVIGRLGQKKNKTPAKTNEPNTTEALASSSSDTTPIEAVLVPSAVAKSIPAKPKPPSSASNPKLRKATKPVSDQPRSQRSNGILTKTGLYLTITDSGLRVGPLDNVPKKPSKPRGRQAPPATPSSATQTGSLQTLTHPDDSKLAGSLPGAKQTSMNMEYQEQSVLSQLNLSDSNPSFDAANFDIMQMLDPAMFDMPIEQLLAPSAVHSTASAQNDFFFDISDFFNEEPAVTLNSMECIPHLGTGDMECQSSFLDLGTNPLDFPPSSASQGQSQGGSATDFDSVFMDIFGEPTSSNDFSPLFASNGLDAIMTHGDLNASNVAANSGNTHSAQSDHMDNLLFQLQGSTTHNTLQPSPWLPVLPEKNFQQYRSVSPSSSLSSVSSFTTSGSTLSSSNANSNYDGAPRAPSRKRQYPSISASNPHSSSTYSSTSSNSNMNSGSKRTTPDLKKSARGASSVIPSSSAAMPPLIGMKAPIAPKSLQLQQATSHRRPQSAMAFNTRITPSTPRTRRSLMTPAAIPPTTNSSNQPSTTTAFAQSVVGSVAGARAAAAAAARANVSKHGSSRSSSSSTTVVGNSSSSPAVNAPARSRSGVAGSSGSGARTPAPSGNNSATMSPSRSLLFNSSASIKSSSPASPGKLNRFISSTGSLSKSTVSTAASVGTVSEAVKNPSTLVMPETSTSVVAAEGGKKPLTAPLLQVEQPSFATVDTLATTPLPETNPLWYGNEAGRVGAGLAGKDDMTGGDLFDLLFDGSMDVDLLSGNVMDGIALGAEQPSSNDSSLMVQDDWLF